MAKQWKCAVKFIEEHGHEYEIRERTDKEKKLALEDSYPDLAFNVYYQTNRKPDKFVVAFKQMKHLIEIQTHAKEVNVDGVSRIVNSVTHNKTFLTCIPVRIVRHKNPLTFLESVAKYTIKFEDAAGERYTFSHKTLSEILSGLRDLGYVLTDGAEGALGAMVQAFKESKAIEDNEDMDYIGFFTDKDNKIIESNIEIKEPVIPDLNDALMFIEELKDYYENRLDLLSTSIVWGMIAPSIFMLKTNNYFLKWLHFHGFPNATKSNTGKIILALDGHHDDPKFLLNIARIDTIARLGDTVSHTTFPKLVDEVDLNGERMAWLVNAIKSAIEGRVVRSKFPTNRATSSVELPALSPLILTSNPPPPFHDSAYMRRVVARNFPQSETWKENDPVAIKFKEFLRMNLKRLKALGDFRNWYIRNNQQLILDEARPPPLDLGFKILSEAYKAAGRTMPDWLSSSRLPENQLEESLEDNGVIVKRAFEKYIDEQINRAVPIWRAELAKDSSLDLPSEITDRLQKLALDNFLPDIKWIKKSWEFRITHGILAELYRCGVTSDQCPNLRGLADYMKATYGNVKGKNKALIADKACMHSYFDVLEGE